MFADLITRPALWAATKIGSIPLSSTGPSRALAIFGGRSSSAGIAVNEQVAFAYSAFTCGCEVLSNGLKVAPAFLYRRKPNRGGKDRVDGHRVFSLVHDAPNREQTPSQFKAFMQVMACAWGTGYAEIERDRMGRPVALWPIHTSRVTARRDANTRELYFEVSMENAAPVRIPDADMLRIPGLSIDGLTGISRLTYAQETIGTSVAAERYGGAFYANQAVPLGALSFTTKPTDQDLNKYREDWKQRHSGDNAHSPAVFWGGMDWKSIGIPQETAQYIETRRFTITDFARWFNIPPHKLKDLERATFSNIEHQEIDFVNSSLTPWYVTWEEELTRKLLTDDERAAGMFVEFEIAGLLRGDSAGRSAFYKTLSELGVVTINELRAWENLNNIGPAGDQHLVPLNMTTAERMMRGETSDGMEPSPKAPPMRPAKQADVSAESVARDVAEIAESADINAVADLASRLTPAITRLLRLESSTAARWNGLPAAERRRKAKAFYGERFPRILREELAPYAQCGAETLAAVLTRWCEGGEQQADAGGTPQEADALAALIAGDLSGVKP